MLYLKQPLVSYIYMGIELQTCNGSVFALSKGEFLCVLQASSLYAYCKHLPVFFLFVSINVTCLFGWKILLRYLFPVVSIGLYKTGRLFR
jgi:hypothetical protein